MSYITHYLGLWSGVMSHYHSLHTVLCTLDCCPKDPNWIYAVVKVDRHDKTIHGSCAIHFPGGKKKHCASELRIKTMDPWNLGYLGHQMTNTLPETNSWPLKIDHWKFGDSYWKPAFLGAMLVVGSVSNQDLTMFFLWVMLSDLPEPYYSLFGLAL